MIYSKWRSHFLPLLIITAVLLGAGLCILPLTSPDEGRNASAAWGMLSSGHFLTPMFNGEPRLIKPPLLYYFMLPFMKIFGPGAFAARLPSFLAALVMGLSSSGGGRAV